MIGSAIWRILFLAICLFAVHPTSVSAQNIDVDGVPLPADVKSAPKTNGPFAGAWIGLWGNRLKHILVVEDVKPDGTATVVYANGTVIAWGTTKSAARYPAAISDDALTVKGSGFTATYRLRPSGKLIATFHPQHGLAAAVMRAEPLETLRQATAPRWSDGTSEMMETTLIENGKPIRLEVVVFKPKGPGPFPLAVVSHGSTGRGKNPNIAKRTAVDPGVATYLTDKGYLVAFPQRRGRGKSDGLYDEGFNLNRAEGYACDTDISLKGADRALTDLNAAITALKKRDDVTQTPVLLSGISRGGILSLAYAGQHPDQVSGVINFVGGWMGEACPYATAINGTLFQRAANFPRTTLWLYGDKDPFYSLDHIRKGFAAFSKAGGKGRFLAFNVAGGNGHALSMDWDSWTAPASTYLDTLSQR